MNKLLAISIFCILFAGCATSAKYEKVLSSWVGHDINELTSSWGYPSGSFEAPNGNKVYVYQSGASLTLPTTYQTNANVYGYGNTAFGSATTNVYGGQTITYWCKTFFEADSDGRIVKWSWQGNNCKAR